MGKEWSDLCPVEGLAEFNRLARVAFKCDFLFLCSRAVSELSNCILQLWKLLELFFKVGKSKSDQ